MGKFSKRKKSFYVPAGKRHCFNREVLNTVGYLATCTGPVDKAIRESYSILNEFANKLYGKELSDAEKAIVAGNNQTGNGSSKDKTDTTNADQSVAEKSSDEKSDSEDEDIESSMKKEITAVKKEKSGPFRFYAVPCGLVQNMFIRTLLTDPLPVLLSALEDISSTKTARSQSLARLLPVQSVCRGFPEDIEKRMKKFAADRFNDVKSFYTIIRVKQTTSVTKDQVLGIVLKVMEECAPNCKPVLGDPEVTIIMTVLKAKCFISEAPHYEKYRKYNFQELSAPAEDGKVKETKIVTDKIENDKTDDVEEEESDEETEEPTPKKSRPTKRKARKQKSIK